MKGLFSAIAEGLKAFNFWSVEKNKPDIKKAKIRNRKITLAEELQEVLQGLRNASNDVERKKWEDKLRVLFREG